MVPQHLQANESLQLLALRALDLILRFAALVSLPDRLQLSHRCADHVSLLWIAFVGSHELWKKV